DGNAVTYTNVNLPNFKKVIEYLIGCALPNGDSATLTDENNQPWVVSGALGLAPEWKLGAPTLSDQKYVSACLAARANALGQHVRISLRGAPATLLPSALEKAYFGWAEGAFWGNLFTSTPKIETCTGIGSGLSGRLCTADAASCGFAVKGPCADAAHV